MSTVQYVFILVKMLLHYRDLFLQEAKGRRVPVPVDLGSGSVSILQEWLLGLAAALHTATRQQAQGKAVLCRREGSVLGILRKVHSQSGLEKELSLVAGDTVLAWARGIQAVLDGLGLLVGEALLPAGRVAGVGELLARLVTSLLARLAGMEEVPSDLAKSLAVHSTVHQDHRQSQVGALPKLKRHRTLQ